MERRLPEHFHTNHTARRHLARLIQLGHVAVAPIATAAVSLPQVYFVSRRGLHRLHQSLAARGIEWQASAREKTKPRGRSPAATIHDLMVTEFMLAVHLTARSRPDLQLLMTEQRYHRPDNQLRFWRDGDWHRVEPDAGFLVRSAGDRGLRLYFVEMDNGTEGPARIAAKYADYAQWSHSTEGERYLARLFRRHGSTQRPDFRVVIPAHDGERREGGDWERLAELFTIGLDAPSVIRDRLLFTTAEDLKKHQYESDPLEAVCWLRARDFRPWRREYDIYLRQQAARRPTWVSRRRFVAPKLVELPGRPVFPSPA